MSHSHKWTADRLEYMPGDVVLVFYRCRCGLGNQRHEFIGVVPETAS